MAVARRRDHDLHDLRIGCDLVEPQAVRESIAAFGDRYLDRVFTPDERRQSGDDPERLAGRFAAKEAVVKVLRPAPTEPVDLRDVAVLHDEHGAPTVVLSGTALVLADRQGLGTIAVSLSHERGLAMGTAVSRTRYSFRFGRWLATLLAWTTRPIPRP